MINKKFYEILTQQAKKEFTTKSEYCISVYRFWEEKGYVTENQMKFLKKGFNGNNKRD